MHCMCMCNNQKEIKKLSINLNENNGWGEYKKGWKEVILL